MKRTIYLALALTLAAASALAGDRNQKGHAHVAFSKGETIQSVVGKGTADYHSQAMTTAKGFMSYNDRLKAAQKRK